MAVSDHELVEQARRGDRGAFDRLVLQHGPELLKYLSTLTRRKDDALDLFQDSFLAAFRSLGTLRDPSAFRSWVATIASNFFKKRARRAGLESTTADVDALLAADTANSEPDADRVERDGRLRAAIEQLPERQRAVLSMRLDLGLPFQRIAQTLGIQEDNARACHYQALKSLRRKLPAFAARFGAER